MSGIKRDSLDALFSQYIRARAGWRCEYSGETDCTLDCAHILSRRHRNTRWDDANAVCLSRRWHMWFEEHPHEWADFTRRVFGHDHIKALQERAYSTEKVTDADKKAIAADLVARVEALGEAPVWKGGTQKKRAKKKSALKRKVDGTTVRR